MSAPGRRKRRGLQIWLSLLAIVILGWTLFPVYYMLLLSFTPTDDLFQPGLYVEHPTVRNYTYTMGADNPFVRYFWHQIGNSIVVIGGLKPGEQIITLGATELTDGGAITVLP